MNLSNNIDRRLLWIGIKRSLYLLILMLPLTILLCTVFNMCLGYRALGNIILPFPTADTVARQYLNELVNGNTATLGDLVPDYQKYRGAQIRNIQTKAESESGNSDHFFEVTTISFEYRDRLNQWQPASFALMTDSNIERGNSFMDSLPFRRVIRSGWN
jgi:hypothetical protein